MRNGTVKFIYALAYLNLVGVFVCAYIREYIWRSEWMLAPAGFFIVMTALGIAVFVLRAHDKGEDEDS